MRHSALYLATALFTCNLTVNAAVFRFDTVPAAGVREPDIMFNIGTDVFSINPLVFGVGQQLLFANELVGDLPTSDVNFVVLQTTDDDADPTTGFGARNAATLIGNQIMSPGPGFFIYFNSNLDRPRLVFSTDLDDPNANIRILARMINFDDPIVMPTFTAGNVLFFIPEPSTGLLVMGAGVFWAGAYLLRRRRNRA
jgi:hypothetical protein